MRLIADHRQDYPSDTALAEAVAAKVGVGRETVRLWLVQADVNAGTRSGATSGEQAELKRLKAENKRLRDDNEILRAASASLAEAGALGGTGRHWIKSSALLLHYVVPDGIGRSVLQPGQFRTGCLECFVVVPAGPVLP